MKTIKLSFLFLLFVFAWLVSNNYYEYLIVFITMGIIILLFLFNHKLIIYLYLLIFSWIPILKSNHSFFQGTNFSINIDGALNILLIFVGILYILLNKINFREKFLKLFIIYAIYFFLILLIVSKDINFGLREFTHFISPVIVYIIIKNSSQNVKDLRNLLIIIFASSILPIIFGIYQYFFTVSNDYKILGVNRTLGTFGHPSDFSFYLYSIFFSLIIYRDYFAKYRKIINMTLMIVLFVFITTFIRISWLSMFISILLYYKSKINLRYAIIVSMILIGILIQFKPVQTRILGQNKQFEYTDIDKISVGRISIWERYLSASYKNFWYGYGPGATYKSSKILKIQESMFPHNEFIRVFFETGIIGLILFIVYFFSLFKFRLSAFENSKNLVSQNLSYIGLIIFLGYFLFHLTDNPLTKYISSIYVWSNWGIIDAYNKLQYKWGIK